MTTLHEAAQQALEALEAMQAYAAAERKGLRICDEAITTLRAALAQEQAEPLNLSDRAIQRRLAAQWGYVPAEQAEPAQEPVAVVATQSDVWRGYNGQWAPPGGPIKTALMLKDMPVGTTLYTAPPRRTMVPLTEEEIWALYFSLLSDDLDRSERIDFARAIEKASWEKNHGQA